MNTIIKILAMALLVIGLVGCQSSEVPPTPDSPGGVAGEYSVAVEDLGTWANPAVGFMMTKDEVVVNQVNTGASVDGVILDSESWLWSEVYVYNFESEAWHKRSAIGDRYKGTNWIRADQATLYGNEIDQVNLPIFVNEEQTGQNLIAVYSCAKEGSSFDCHGGWQVEGFDVIKESIESITFSVGVSGTVENSSIVISPSGNTSVYTDVVLELDPEMNIFNIESASVDFEQEATSTILFEIEKGTDLNAEPIILNGNWEEEGEYRFTIRGNGVETEEQTQSVTIEGDMAFSLPDLPINFGESTEEKEVLFTLKQGWTRISFPFNEVVKQTDLPRECDVRSLYITDQDGTHKASMMYPGYSYDIFTNSNCEVTLENDYTSYTSINRTFVEGWNNIGAPSTELALEDFPCVTADIAWTYNSGRDKASHTLFPFQGYHLHFNESCDLTGTQEEGEEEVESPDCPLPDGNFTVESSFRETFGCVYEGLEWQGAGLIANSHPREAFCELLGGNYYKPVGDTNIPTSGTVTMYSLGEFYHQELESTSIMSQVGCANV